MQIDKPQLAVYAAAAIAIALIGARYVRDSRPAARGRERRRRSRSGSRASSVRAGRS